MTTPTTEETAGAAAIADVLRERAADMPLDSPIRELALRSASRWERLAREHQRPRLQLMKGER